MRVLLIANTLPPTDLSGVGEQVLQLAAGLEAAGHDVEVLSRTLSGPGRAKIGFPVTVLPRLVAALRRFRPHVVQVHESDGALAALLVATLAATLETAPTLLALLQVSYVEEFRAVRPLVSAGRVVGRPGWRELAFKWIKAPLQIGLGCLTVQLAERVMAPSRRTAAELERDYRAEDVATLPNVMGGRSVTAGRDESVDESGFFLYVGRLRLRKAVELLLEAVASLPAGAPRLLIVGDGEHRSRLERFCSALDLGERTLFLGRRSPGQVRDLLRRARALVVPSIYEGMPLVVLEAMEQELPVVATRVSGIPEVVVDGETGWLVPAEDSLALAAALRQVAADEGECRRRGLAGAQRLRALYSPEAAGRTWETVVESAGGFGENRLP